MTAGLTSDFLSTLPEAPTAPRAAGVAESCPVTVWKYYMPTERLLPLIPTIHELLTFEFGPEQAQQELIAINSWRSRGNTVWLVLDTERRIVSIAMSPEQRDEIRGPVVIFTYPPTN